MDPASPFSFDMSYCGSPPTPAELWLRWNTDPVLLVGLLLVALAGAWALRKATRQRQFAFAGAWTVAAILFVSPLCALTVSLFSARVAHHAILAVVVAPLLASSLPSSWGRRIPPSLALTLSTILLWLWHAPDVYASAFSHPAVYWAMQFSIIASFTALWLSLLRGEVMATSIAALLSAIQMGLLGALLVFAQQPLYLPHLATTLAFGLHPLDDQQLGGLIMWVPANLPLLALLLWRLMALLAPAREVRSE
jgi:putative membrane protein